MDYLTGHTEAFADCAAYLCHRVQSCCTPDEPAQADIERIMQAIDACRNLGAKRDEFRAFKRWQAEGALDRVLSGLPD
jgi:hypothetical protein